jgi:hypothetical protein
VLVLEAAGRRRVLPRSLVLWPAIVGLSCSALPHLLGMAFHRGVIGIVHPLTVALCALTIVFTIASAASLWCAVGWCVRPDRPSLARRAVPTACAIAAFSLALWFAANGLIGLRTWAW